MPGPNAPQSPARAVFDALASVLHEDRQEKFLAARVLMRLLVSDGALHPSERTMLDTTMDRFGLDLGRRAAIWAESIVLLQPDSVADPQVAAAAAQPLEQLVAALPRAAAQELLAHLHHGAWADGVVVQAEQAVIAAVERRLA
ncbi:MAG: hypothetical protein K1X88_16155 [Nannocystaceae bacterium]|nr:hypothetical protein [Nannocystaceae bacterium]